MSMVSIHTKIFNIVIAASAALTFVLAAEEFMEPKVSRFARVLPQHACQELIRLGEESGFNVVEESIDDYEVENIPSQSIEVYSYDPGDEKRIIDKPIWDALQPYMKVFSDLVKQTRDEEQHLSLYPDDPNREPMLDWIFFRKYSPTSDRNSLIPHVDTNVYTLNIALNDNFEGGGLFYVRPHMQDIVSEDGRPELKPEKTRYDWTNTIKRENISDVVFPDMHAGDVLIHNYTVWHGVAPLDKGERYSFVLFYDMDNPRIDDMDTPDDEDEFVVEFYHEIEDSNVTLMYVEELPQGEELLDPMLDPFLPFQGVTLGSYEGHRFKLIAEGTDEVVAEFVVKMEQRRYVALSKQATQDDEL